ncbi:MAG: DNA repair ATPase [Thermoanaerobaculia bacterium]|nr:DNA repair ATPase [Thermoanaerobaculia bacterium]
MSDQAAPIPEEATGQEAAEAELDAPTTPGDAAPTGDRIEKGAYEILRARLNEQATELKQRAESLNRSRLDLFGGTEMAVVGNERIRTENNCVPRDIVKVGSRMLFGYNVFLGLRTETKVEDVFTAHRFQAEAEAGSSFEPIAPDASDNFLQDDAFRRDFVELYKYYKDATLDQLRLTEEGRLLMVFRTGGGRGDLKVLRWQVSPDGEIRYVDNRGERDHTFPASHGFEWTETTRDDHVLGRHPHVSILDQVFVETVGGDLTVKVEDNTEDGQGIYRELVDEPHQSLADAEIHFAQVGLLILLKIQPYNERSWRFLVFNTRNHDVERIDAIGQSCQLLPEDHGIIFPGGYYLQSGETKSFEGDVEEMIFKRAIRSPNGEDVLFVFYAPREGRSILLNYNLIRKQVENPIYCHGWAIFDDGRLVLFRSTSDEPTRVHPMQIWQTPFVSDEFAATAPKSGSYLEKVGNADLVRGISDSLSLVRKVTDQEPSVAIYEEIIATATRMKDGFYWLGEEPVGDLKAPLDELQKTADLIVGEFQKVETLRRQARQAVAEATQTVEELFHRLRSESRDRVDHYVQALADLRTERGRLMTLREQRYVDEQAIDGLESRVVERFEELSGNTVDFLLGGEALAPYHREIEGLVGKVEEVKKTSDARPIRDRLDEIGDGLELLTDVVGGLDIDDPTQRTAILEEISEVLASLNRGRAVAEAKRKELLSVEGRAEFGAQFQLFSQSVSGALAMADTPEKCDEQLSKLLLQLEELESRFGEFDDFLDQLATKREDVYEALSSRKQSLVDERQRRAERMMQAAERILDGIRRRASALEDLDALNTYFVSDAMVAKIRDLGQDLRQIGDTVKADELDSRLKSAREEAARSLRDRRDIYEGGDDVLKLGRHRFSVNTRPVDLTMVPRRATRRAGKGGDEFIMAFHLTGTDFYQTVDDPEFQDTKPFWDQLVVSETPRVYRGEYLAAEILAAAEEERAGLSLDRLRQTAREGVEGEGPPGEKKGGLLVLVREFASERYDEGYERGLHDQDAALILEQLLALYTTAGLLRFAPRPRALATLFWAYFNGAVRRVQWERRAASLQRLRDAFAHSSAIAELKTELAGALSEFLGDHGITLHPDEAQMVGAYLFEELTHHPVRFTRSAEAERLREKFLSHLDLHESRSAFDEDLRELQDDLRHRWRLAVAWVKAFLDDAADAAREEGDESGGEIETLRPSLEEAVVSLLTETRVDHETSSALGSRQIQGLLGQHARIESREMELRLDEFLARLTAFRTERVPGFREFQERRHELLEFEREHLRLDEYKPKVMSAFVRNQLINDVYLPLIGDNLAKQMGTVGDGKRTDQMGLLLLVSPPGYGKTTLMEYLANRLGLIFVKVNGPALGHGVVSLDPEEAPNATARQEVDKINFALEMANNVLLYLDDIQHTSSELLQKFISLCDAQRRIEGVWNGRTRTYDLKGKRFAVCMAGNPYTESGEKFQIPDMLANRADTYNLGDILEGRDEVFALSYIENSLTSNPTLAPLAGRDLSDVPKLVRMAKTGEIQSDRLSHGYSQVELEEILAVLDKMLKVQSVVLKVNQQYIASAAQDDRFRTEPRFQLQGSYRNMNKMAEKVVAVMNEKELEALIDDHYNGEAQTLTTGAEANLLKLAELRDKLSPEQAERWDQIKRSFARVQAMGGADDDPAVKLVGQLGLMSDRLSDIDRAIQKATADGESEAVDNELGARLVEALSKGLTDSLVPFAEGVHKNLESLQKLQKAGVKAKPGAGVAPAALEAMESRLDVFLERLAELAQHAAQSRAQAAAIVEDGKPKKGKAAAKKGAPPPVPEGQPIQIDFGPYLERLDSTLQFMAENQGQTIMQSLGPGVIDLLDELGQTISGHLLPLTQHLGGFMKDHGIEDRTFESRLDRALKNLDMMKELVGSLRRIDTITQKAKK